MNNSITNNQLSELNLSLYTIIDLRDTYSYNQYHLPDSINIPYSILYKNIMKIPYNKPLLFICQNGYQAKEACLFFNYHKRTAYYLKGGLNPFNPPHAYY